MDLGAEQRGEAGPAAGARIGDGEAVARQEMIRQGEEVVARFPVDLADLLGRQAPIRERRMSVDVALQEAPGRGEGRVVLHGPLRCYRAACAARRIRRRKLPLQSSPISRAV
jgi:hypothetical protein